VRGLRQVHEHRRVPVLPAPDAQLALLVVTPGEDLAGRRQRQDVGLAGDAPWIGVRDRAGRR
jgi:hypothetical protein